MLNSGNYSPWHLNELASALGTLEFAGGRSRKARMVFRKALDDPSENTIAQVRWATASGLGLDFDRRWLAMVPGAHEAGAWSHHDDGAWSQSFADARQWFSDQSFSSRPVVLGSFVAAVALEDHTTSIEMLREALRANPDHFLLLNNLAFSLASLGRIEEARHHLDQIKVIGSDDNARILKLATGGFIEYRSGNPNLGRLLYEKAAEQAKSRGRREIAVRLNYFWALEEVRSRGPRARELVQRAIDTKWDGSEAVRSLLSNRLQQRAEKNRA